MGPPQADPPFLVFCIGMFSLGFPDVLPPTIHSVPEYTLAHVAPHLYSVTYSSVLLGADKTDSHRTTYEPTLAPYF